VSCALLGVCYRGLAGDRPSYIYKCVLASSEKLCLHVIKDCSLLLSRCPSLTALAGEAHCQGAGCQPTLYPTPDSLR
jgi:hypothetical protein